MCAPPNIPKLEPTPKNRTPDLMVVRPDDLPLLSNASIYKNICGTSLRTLLTLSKTSPSFYMPKSFENTLGKGEIARNEQFLLFPQCFVPARTLYHFDKI